jgi:hypothetical protein
MAAGPTRTRLKNDDPRSCQEFVARLAELSLWVLVAKFTVDHQGARHLINDRSDIRYPTKWADNQRRHQS